MAFAYLSLSRPKRLPTLEPQNLPIEEFYAPHKHIWDLKLWVVLVGQCCCSQWRYLVLFSSCSFAFPLWKSFYTPLFLQLFLCLTYSRSPLIFAKLKRLETKGIRRANLIFRLQSNDCHFRFFLGVEESSPSWFTNVCFLFELLIFMPIPEIGRKKGKKERKIGRNKSQMWKWKRKDVKEGERERKREKKNCGFLRRSFSPFFPSPIFWLAVNYVLTRHKIHCKD